MIKQQCEVCQETEHKYKCPQCRILYCSVGCFKTHKDTCLEKPQEEKKTEATAIEEDLPCKPVPDFQLIDEESEDRVAEDRLRLLGESAELKEALSNGHLRQIMTSLVHSDEPVELLEEAMHEPIFTEFADKCLSVIDGDESDDDDKS